MLNVNDMAEGHAYYQVAGISIHPNKQAIAFGEDTVSTTYLYHLHQRP